MIEEYTNREFMIFNISELDKIDFSQVLETSKETLKISKNGEKTFVKWNGVIPECISLLETKEGAYTYYEIIDILSTDEWTSDYFSKQSIINIE